jgi:DNA (cytosine-5)-methyltransferase 1
VNFYEFFAGGGFVRLGLGDAWRCLFANDIDPAKTRAYRRNFGTGELRCGDIGRLECTDLPSQADLAWASFPCQDLSAAGLGAGLSGARSGLFWEFSRLIEGLSAAGRAPSMLAIENVLGTTTARNGRDLEIICQSLSQAGYRFGPLVVDASLFVPQSRPRLFIIALRDGMAIPDGLAGSKPSSAWHPAALRRIYAQLEPAEARRWIWWKPRYPRGRIGGLETLLETAPNDVIWHSSQETERLLDMMSDDVREKVRRARCDGTPVIGCAYVRTRPTKGGAKGQRLEVRLDGQAGCLRTPAGGSSRQIILQLDGERIRSRLLSAREAARLMGIPDTYRLPDGYTDACHLVGDGVAVPVVSFLAESIILPTLKINTGTDLPVERTMPKKGRPRLNPDHALTPAQRAASYRERRAALRLGRVTAAAPIGDRTIGHLSRLLVSTHLNGKNPDAKTKALALTLTRQLVRSLQPSLQEFGIRLDVASTDSGEQSE